MNIVLFGEDSFTAAVLQRLITENHQISAVVCPFHAGNREHEFLKKTADKKNISFLHVADVNAEELRNQLTALAPDLMITVHLTKILFPSIYLIAARAAINVHPSLLPKYRGLSPQHQAIIHGDRMTGVSVHFIEQTPDTGNIICQEEIPLREDSYIFELQTAMMPVYKHLVSRAIQMIETDSPDRVMQDENKASWFGRLKRSDRKIELVRTKLEIYNLIRAVSKPYKGAFYLALTIWAAYFPDTLTEERLSAEYPDSGIYFSDDLLIMRLKDGFLLSEDYEKNILDG